jgi:hypothetical protein
MTSLLPMPREKVLSPDGGMSETWYTKLKSALSKLDVLGSSFDSLGPNAGTLGTAALRDIGTSGATVPVLDAVNAWSRQQTFTAAELTYASTITWNLNSQQVATVTLTGNATLAAPSNRKNGGTYILIVKQDGTGGRTLGYSSLYKWAAQGVPSLTPDANAVDILTFVSDGTNMYGAIAKDFG